MTQKTLYESMHDPQFYPTPVHHLQVLQTHISMVGLTGTYAYKVKKPVNFGFLDFSTLEKRKHFCEEELRLNKRLCPDVYLKVVPITQENTALKLNGKGIIVDYAVQMKEFPQDRIMTRLLQQNEITEDVITKICDRLVAFYASGEHTKEIDSYGRLEAVKQNIDENFEQTQSVVDITISKQTYDFIKNANAGFFTTRKKVFDQRINDKKIHDCHGDLHSGNIVIVDDICIFDCIEFNTRFRYCDVASDIGFLAMDLDYQNQPYLSSHLIHQYEQKSGDIGIYDVLNFYKSYRAYVRGKVHGFQLNDPHTDASKKQGIITTAQQYFALSEYYARLFSYDITKKRPLLVLVNGLTGTGKSTVALKIAVDYHAEWINTDIVRKELAGIDKFERHHDALNTGLYDPKNVDSTYENVAKKAHQLLQKGHNVVVDATFQKKKYRDLIYDVVKQTKADFIAIQCVCPDNIVQKRLEQRVKNKSVSDGRWEIYVQMKQTFEPFTGREPHLKMDTSQDTKEYRKLFYDMLLTRIAGG